jgi:hypothetical protein
MIMESCVISDMNRMYGMNAWVFQDDGASPHRAKKARAFLANQCFTLSTELHWPAQSPDLNVIENVWALLKGRMTVSNCTNEDQLWAEAQAAWDLITIEEVNRTVDSFQDRLRAVAALDGQTLNGHRAVQQLVKAGHTIDEIREMVQNQESHIHGFIGESEHLFEAEPWEPDREDFQIRESRRIVQILPEIMRRKVVLMIYNESNETKEMDATV